MMNPKVAELMRNHGIHKHISEECQHRIEHISMLIIEECCKAMKPMLRDMISRGQAVDMIKEHFGIE